MRIPVLFQDDEILVINKPAGVVVNKADTTLEPTIQDFIDTHFDSPLSHDFDHRNGIVHRLDKDTSGVLVIAKTLLSLESLLAQFKDREVKKVYRALLHGKLTPNEGHVRVPMARNPFNRQKFKVMPGGKVTVTNYTVLHFYETVEVNANLKKAHYDGFTYVEVYPETGRTHQLRVVFSHLHHPIVGDDKYVGRKRIRFDALWNQRHFLHAYQLTLFHPISRQPMVFTAELPSDLASVLQVLA